MASSGGSRIRPAILLTGYTGETTALAIGGAVSGSFSLLRKPVSSTQLADRMAVLLEDAKATRGRDSTLS